MAMQESGEMYLETIYILSKKSSCVRGVDVGEYMGYSKPSVSRAVSLLKKEGFALGIKRKQPGRRMRQRIIVDKALHFSGAQGQEYL